MGRVAVSSCALAVNRIAMMSRRPNLFVIGAAKSGTTSLHDYLDGHPQIFMSPLKEPGFFSPDAPPPRKRYAYTDSLEHYLTLFDEARDELLVGESSTYYLFSRQAPRLVQEFEPRSKIVAMLRNPVDMAHSMHGHRFAHGKEPLEDFAAALEADEAADSGGAARRRVIEREGTYMERARYADQLSRWFGVFPREVRVIVFEEFVANPQEEYQGLLEFLGVEPTHRPQDFSARNTRHRISAGPVSKALRSRPAAWARHRALPSLVGTRRAARIGRTIGMSSLIREETASQPIDPQLRARLWQELADDVDRLSALLGRNMTEVWGGTVAHETPPVSYMESAI